jgi:Holliday junction resolvase RusA-like endonuclease
MPDLSFFCPGVPRAKGSPHVGMRKGGGHPFVRIDNPAERDWRRAVGFAAHEAMKAQGRELYTGGVVLLLTFVAVRATSHHTSKGALRKGAPLLPASKPDADKLLRSVCDSLTGIVYKDDAQVTLCLVAKRYGPTAGVYVEVAADMDAPPMTAVIEALSGVHYASLKNALGSRQTDESDGGATQ